MIKVLFFGTPHFAVPSHQTLINMSNVRVAAVITQPDRPSGRGSTITSSPIKQMAEAHQIPVLQHHSIRKEFATIKRELDLLGSFDIGVVIAFGQILPLDVLRYPRAGCINIHASMLPRWRGAAPIHRAIEAGDESTGVCLMQMDEGLDTGPVFSQIQQRITSTETTGTLHDTLAHAGAALLAQDLEAIVAGDLKSTPQPDTAITYAKKVTSQEAEINWSESATVICRKIRAFNPYPGSFTIWHERRLKILQAQPSNFSTDHKSPGTVVSARPTSIIVQCGTGTINLEELQLEGKRKMSTEEFMRGQPITVGTHLGRSERGTDHEHHI